MATLSSSNLTLADWAKRSDPDGKVLSLQSYYLKQTKSR